jgi:hypothetical protein
MQEESSACDQETPSRARRGPGCDALASWLTDDSPAVESLVKKIREKPIETKREIDLLHVRAGLRS